jgi:VanZ family protein
MWLLPLAWMATIMWLSTGGFSSENTGSVLEPLFQWLLPWASAAQIAALHSLVRRSAHVAEYGVLTALWFITFRHERGWSARRAAWIALSIAIGWGFLDELHQATQPTRSGSIRDVVYDAIGALLAVIVARSGWRRVTSVATSALLWTAAAGGAGAIAVNLASGVRSGVLWLTVPVATALLLVWRRGPSRL